MKFKRLMPLAMAGVLSASMMVPAFAANTATEISGSFRDIEIEVVVPETGTTYINPYGLPITLDDTAKTTISGEQITTLPLAITNKSSVNLDIGATVSATLPRTATMTLTDVTTKAVASPADKKKDADTAKNAYVILEAAKHATLTTVEDEPKAWYAEFAKDASWDSAANVLVVTTEPNTSDPTKPLVTGLKKVNASGAVQAGGIALFRLSGDCVESPADDSWTENDTFTVNIAFTFKPSADQT